MRPAVLMAIVALSSATPFTPQARAAVQDPPRPLEIQAFTFAPKPAAVGQEITVTVSLKNTTSRLLLANVRLMLPPEVEIVLPDLEQIVFLEAAVTREIRWKAKVIREGPWRLHVDPSVISEGRPLAGAHVRVPEPHALALKKAWSGTWTTPRGYEYAAEFRVRLDTSGALEGRLDWTLQKAPPERSDYADKIGAKGVEYVWGTYDPATRVLEMEGYRRDDPRLILGIDRYRLTLAEDLSEISGATREGGDWKASFRLKPL